MQCCSIIILFKHTQLRQLNRCCLYLQVLTVSDISSADRKYVLQPFLDGLKDTQQTSMLQWSFQQRPSEADWQQWLYFLRFLATRNCLNRKLGHWVWSPLQEWHWCYHQPDRTVFHYSGDIWHCYPPVVPQRQRLTRSSRLYYKDFSVCPSPLEWEPPSYYRPCKKTKPHGFHITISPNVFPADLPSVSPSLWDPSTTPNIFFNTPLYFPWTCSTFLRGLQNDLGRTRKTIIAGFAVMAHTMIP
jgi:hypothetical protein